MKPVFIFMTDSTEEFCDDLQAELAKLNLPYEVHTVDSSGSSLGDSVTKAERIGASCILVSCSTDISLPEIISKLTYLPVLAFYNENSKYINFNEFEIICPIIKEVDAAWFVARLTTPYNQQIKDILIGNNRPFFEYEKESKSKRVSDYNKIVLATNLDSPVINFDCMLDGSDYLIFSDGAKIKSVNIKHHHSLKVSTFDNLLTGYARSISYSGNLISVFDTGNGLSLWNMNDDVSFIGRNTLGFDCLSADVCNYFGVHSLVMLSSKIVDGKCVGNILIKALNKDLFVISANDISSNWRSYLKNNYGCKIEVPGIKAVKYAFGKLICTTTIGGIKVIDSETSLPISKLSYDFNTIKQLVDLYMSPSYWGYLGRDTENNNVISVLDHTTSANVIYKLENVLNVTAIAIHPYNKELAIGFDDGNLHIFDFKNNDIMQVINLNHRIRQIKYSQSGRYIAVLNSNDALHLLSH